MRNNEELPFDESCDNYCNYIEDYKRGILDLSQIITEKNKLIDEIMKENTEYKRVMDAYQRAYRNWGKLQED